MALSPSKRAVTRSPASWSTPCKNVYEAEYKDEMATHQDLVRAESRVLMEKIEGNNETLIELREENRALVEKVEDNNRLLSALCEELARRP